MKAPYLFAIVALATSCYATDDIRSKTASPETAQSRIIDPDKSIFGVPLGTSEDGLIKKFGKPVGYMRLTDNGSLMLYGDTMAFIFQSGKLSGILLQWGGLFDSRLKSELASKNLLGDKQWELSNGLKNNMNLVNVRGILGDSLLSQNPMCKNSRYQQYYLTDKSKVSLGFTRKGRDNEEDEHAYWLSSVRVEPKKKDDY